MKFYKCNHCGNIITFVEDKGVPVMCCGEKMQELIPGEIDASKEKHVPVVNVNANKVLVTIGEQLHPMIEAHHISWIAIETEQGNQIKYIQNEPTACFRICDNDNVKAVYAYCNLHGLWKKEV